MARYGALNARLDSPDLISQNQMEQYDNSGENVADRSTQWPLAPLGVESRTMIADRVGATWQPDPNYAEQDSQKGGAPGSAGGAPGGSDPEGPTNFITAQEPDGTTTPGGVPKSPIKLSFGESDYSSYYPTFLPSHLKIAIRQNPNAAQNNVGQWASEGPMANTQYQSPAPWAAGSFIG